MIFQLERLTLHNFKGIRKAEIDFGPVTELSGKNATGKTTVLDAFLWLLFGKDSSGRKDFEIKTLDADNNALERLDHEVEGEFQISRPGQDFALLKLRRVFSERWVKKRGNPRAVFDGHTTEYFWNDVPVKEKEYAAKLHELIPEDVFRLLTNTGYFNSLPWAEQRAALVSITPPITDEAIFANTSGSSADFTALKEALDQGKSLLEFAAELRAKKRDITRELDYIPAKIEEAKRALPEAEDYAVLDARRVNLDNELTNIDRELTDQNAAEEIRGKAALAKQGETLDLRAQALGIKHRYNAKISDDKRVHAGHLATKKIELRAYADALRAMNLEREAMEWRRKTKVAELGKLRDTWIEKNKEELAEDKLLCPTCHRPYGVADAEYIEDQFREAKAKQLQELNTAGLNLKNELTVIETGLAERDKEIKTHERIVRELTARITALEAEDQGLPDDATRLAHALEADTEYQGIKEMIRLREEEVASPPPANSRRLELLARSAEIKVEMKVLIERLAMKEQRDRITKRVDELLARERVLTESLTTLEGAEFAVDQYSRAKTELLEQAVNRLFTRVRFKLFDKQVNGEEIETCVALINGVPYKDANTAAKVQAGLDIINVFSKFYNVFAPVWIDNRESVVELPPTESQLITLRVVADQEKLAWRLEPTLS